MKKSKNIIAGTIITGALAFLVIPGNSQGTSVLQKDFNSEAIRTFKVNFPQVALD